MRAFSTFTQPSPTRNPNKPDPCHRTPYEHNPTQPNRTTTQQVLSHPDSNQAPNPTEAVCFRVCSGANQTQLNSHPTRAVAAIPNTTQPNPTEALCYRVCSGSNSTQPNSNPTLPNFNPTRVVAPQPNPTQQRQYVGIRRWRQCVRNGWNPKVLGVIFKTPLVACVFCFVLICTWYLFSTVNRCTCFWHLPLIICLIVE